MKYKIKPCTLKQANQLVSEIHRHHRPVTGHRFSLALYDDWFQLEGVVICGRPVARNTDPYTTLEILRCATKGGKNAISKLYGACYRIAKEMGFETLQTFTLPEEGGASMRASNFVFVGESKGGQWKHTDGKERRSDQPICIKHKWIIKLQK